MQQAKQGDFKPFDAHDWKIGMVISEFNKPITDSLLSSALKRAKEYKIEESNISVVHVPGSVEIPLILQNMAKSGNYNALLAIGCVVQGATPHFDYVCKFVTEGVLRVQLDHGIPVGFGILTCNNQEQAEERKNLGGDHLDAAMHVAKLLEK